MMTIEPTSKTPAEKTAPKVSARELLQRRSAGDPIVLMDVREAAAFGARHIGGALHSPDSQTTALVKKLLVHGSAILVCDDGRHSAMVARTLGFCGFRQVTYLEGGLAAWEAAGGRVVETTRSGLERELRQESTSAPKKSERSGFFSRLALLLRA